MGPWRRVNFSPKLESRELEKTVLRVGLGAEFHAQEAWQVCGGGRASGLPGDEELHREAWGEEQVKPRSSVRQTEGREYV